MGMVDAPKWRRLFSLPSPPHTEPPRIAMRTLYLVPTPIGNMEDITLRALRVLRSADLIAAEDTRVTRGLLARHGIAARLTSFHAHSGRRKTERLLARLADGEDVALVSDAGTPAVNDPGRELVAAAAARGFRVVALPGASAVTTALAASGIAADGGFAHLGFLPRRRADRLRLLREVAAERKAQVAFETPHRLARALADIREALGDRRVAVCRELTKMHEEVFRGTVSEAIAHFAEPRGEFTLVIEGASEPPPPKADAPDASQALARLKGEGASARDAVAAVSEATGAPRRDLYALWLAIEPTK